eukprot:SAG22_NODE_13900_length_391_cov_1.167808_1_plen_106_part_10
MLLLLLAGRPPPNQWRSRSLSRGLLTAFRGTVTCFFFVRCCLFLKRTAADPTKPNYVVAGINVTNAQQLVERRMAAQGRRSACLRTREIRAAHADAATAKLFTHSY